MRASPEVTILCMKVRDIIKLLVVYEKSDTGWAAYVPDLPGVGTIGRARSEVGSLIAEAIEFHLDRLKEDRLPIPEPSAEAEVISISPTRPCQ
jgi:predicted RNase H-like HicB family nuclease